MATVEQTAEARLTDLLGRLAAKQDEFAAANAVVKGIEGEMDDLETQARDVMELTGMDTCGTAGRTWYLRRDVSVNVPKDKRDAVLAAAEKVTDMDGVTLADDLRTILTGTLKAWLKEQAKATDKPEGEPLAAGTPFAGLVNEFTKVTLCSVAARRG
jgi:hypothetical protein